MKEYYVYDENKKRAGRVCISRNMSQKKAARKKLYRRRIIASVIGGTLAVYGAVELANNLVENSIAGVNNLKQTYEAYQLDKKLVAYTNYSDEQINQLDFYTRCKLYSDYIYYVEVNADNVPLSEEYNFAKLRNDADELVNEVSMYDGIIDEQAIKKEMQSALEKYKKAIELIDKIYYGKYSLNNSNPNDDVIIIGDIQEENQKTL